MRCVFQSIYYVRYSLSYTVRLYWLSSEFAAGYEYSDLHRVGRKVPLYFFLPRNAMRARYNAKGPYVCLCVCLCVRHASEFYHKKLSYRRGTARRATLFETLSNDAERYEKSHLQTLAICEWPDPDSASRGPSVIAELVAFVHVKRSSTYIAHRSFPSAPLSFLCIQLSKMLAVFQKILSPINLAINF